MLSKMVQDTLDKAAVYDMDSVKLKMVKKYLKEKIDFDVKTGIEALRSIERIAPGYHKTINHLISNLKVDAEREFNHAKKILNELANQLGVSEISVHDLEKEEEPKGSDLIPVKLFRGPLSSRPWIKSLDKEDQEAWRQITKNHGISYGGPSTLALYWTNGNRTISEISKLVELETGSTNLPYLVEFYKYLVKGKRAKFLNR
jgi:hypothetical protein